MTAANSATDSANASTGFTGSLGDTIYELPESLDTMLGLPSDFDWVSSTSFFE